MTPITLPGTIPGLLRRGAPLADGCSVVLAVVGDRAVLGSYGSVDGLIETGVEGIQLADCYLDLRDPLGCDIAARWLGERVGVSVGTTAPMWYYNGGRAWTLYGEEGTAARFRQSDHPYLAAVAADEPVAALRAVCLHVAGVGA